MMRTVAALALVAAVGNTANLVASSGRESSPAAARATPQITISNLTYSGDLTVRAGEKVTVTNTDPFDHSLTDKVHHLFDTGTVPANGGTRTFTAPTKAGSYPFG